MRVHVGRGNELHQLDRACDLHTRRVTVLEGPPGVGKTHLLTELAERARARGLRVLTIRATEFEAAVPFGLIGDLLDSPVVPVDPREMARRLALPLTETPTLLIVDDLHWADAASLAVLNQLLTRLPAGRCGLVFAHRAGQWPAQLVEMPPGDAGDRVSIGPLSTVDASVLLAEQPDTLRRRLVEIGHGNPLHLLLLARLADRLDGKQVSPRPSLDETIDLLIGGLTEQQRLVAMAASRTALVPGADLLAAITELDVHAVRAALDGLHDAGVLTGSEFRHPLIRGAVYRLGDPAWRERAHQHVLGWLREQRAPLLARAPHAVRAVVAGDDASVTELLTAGELAMSAAPDASALWLAAVLRVRARGSPGWIEAAVRLGHALLLSGKPRDAIKVLAEAMEFPGEHHRKSLMLQAHSERMRGRAQRAKELIERAAALPGGDRDATVQLELARLDIQDNRRDEGTARVIAMLQHGWVHNNVPMRVAATCLTSIGMVGTGEIEHGRNAYHEAASGLDQLTDAELCDIVDAVPAWAWAGFFLGEHADALPRVERAIEVALRYGHRYAVPLVHTARAELLAQAGRLGDSLEAIEIAQETAEMFGYPDVLPMAGAIRLRVLLWTGEETQALAQWHRLNQMTRPAMLWWSRVVEGELAASAVTLGMRDRYPRGLLDDHSNPMLPMRLLRATTAALARGDLDTAIGFATRAETSATASGLPVQRAAAELARARCAFAQLDLEVAGKLAMTAAEQFGDREMPIYQAQALLLLSEIAAGQGTADQAAAYRAQAQRVLTPTGMTRVPEAA